MAAIDIFMEDEDITTVMQRALRMQIDSEADWRTFKADILASLTLNIFRYMIADLPFVNTLHSSARYAGFGGRLDLVGKVVGFTGFFDQYGGVPAMQFLTPELPWKWREEKVSFDYTSCGTFYTNCDNREEGWAPTESVEFPISLTLIPRMILLTGDMAKAAAKGDMTP